MSPRRYHIKVSTNELTALLRRALEGYGYALADCDDSARTTVWLESAGVAALRLILARLETSALADAPRLTTQRHGTHKWSVQAENSSVLFSAVLISEFAASVMRGCKWLTVDIKACHDPVAMLFVAHECARRGFHVGCRWTHLQQCYAHATPTAPLPNLVTVSGSRESGPVQLLLRTEPFDIASGMADLGIVTTNSSDIVERHTDEAIAKALNHGIDIDVHHYEELQRYGDRVLVESSDRSRAGAGE